MALTGKEKTKLIEKVRDSSSLIIDGINGLTECLEMWNALDMGGSITEDKLQDSDFTGDNQGNCTADIANIFGSTLPALNTFLNQGHATNLYRIRR